MRALLSLGIVGALVTITGCAAVIDDDFVVTSQRLRNAIPPTRATPMSATMPEEHPSGYARFSERW